MIVSPVKHGNLAGASQPESSPADPHTCNAPLIEGTTPPYTAPYPPYLSDEASYTGALPVNAASGLAYFTVAPAIFFLLLEPYRSNETIRFHSWQSIFYFLVLAGARTVEMLSVSMRVIHRL